MANRLTTTSARASAFDMDGELLWDGDYLAFVIAAQTYRSLRRFITHHVAPGADSRIRSMLCLEIDPRAKVLSQDPRALDAWAVAIWSADLEGKASHPRWTIPSTPCGRDREASRPSLVRDAMGMTLSIKAPDGPLRVSQGDWILGHATLAILRDRFARARALAQGMADAGEAELGGEMIGRNRLTLTGEVLQCGELRFTVDAATLPNTLAPRPHRSKSERRARLIELGRRRRDQLSQICAGPCLRFTLRDGWRVATSAVPDLAAGIDVRRNRLFCDGRPPFILFSIPGGWCARMIEAPVEVLDDAPWKTIDTLRYAYSRYLFNQIDRVSKATAEGKSDVTSSSAAGR